VSLSRRGLLSIAGLAGVSAAAAACGRGGPGDRNSNTIEVWTLQEQEQLEPLENAIARFNDSYDGGDGEDVTVEAVPVNQDNYSDQLQVAMGTNNRPDIFFNWGGGSIRRYVEQDLLVDLTPYLEEDTAWRDSWLPSVLNAGQINGRYYGIPLRGMQPVLLFYNQTMFQEMGQQPPATYDDLVNLVNFFTGQGIQPVALAGLDAWTELMWLEYLVDRIGGAEVFQAIADGEEGAWGHPAILQALQSIRELVDAGAFGTNFSSVAWTSGGADTLFASGEAAMHLMGTWEYTNQLNDNPDFARNDLAYANFPQVSGGAGDPAAVVGNPTNYFSVTRSSNNVEAAVEFLRQQMSSDEYVGELIEAGDVPAVADLTERLQSAPNAEFAIAVYEMVQQAPTFTLSWDQALEPDVAELMLDCLQEVFNGDRTPEEFVEELSNA